MHYGEAYWDEFCPQPGRDRFWRQFPKRMLPKCAKAQALREGWAAELSGLYISEEMEQAKEPSFGEAMTQDFPTDTWLPGTLKKILPAAGVMPTQLFIETQDGTMQFSTFLPLTECENVSDCSIHFQYGKQGKLRVVTKLGGTKDRDASAPISTFTPEPQDIPKPLQAAGEPTEDEVVEASHRLAQDRPSYTLPITLHDPPDDNAQEPDEYTPLNEFQPGHTVRGLVTKVEPSNGVTKAGPNKGKPWEKHTLTIEPQNGQDAVCSTFATASHFDKSLTSFNELDKRVVWFTAEHGKEYPKNSGRYPLVLQEICLQPVAPEPLHAPRGEEYQFTVEGDEESGQMHLMG